MDTSHGDPHPPMERRSFLKWATHGLGVLFGALLGVPAVAYLIDARNRPAPNNDFRTVARLSELRKGVRFVRHRSAGVRCDMSALVSCASAGQLGVGPNREGNRT